MLMLRFLAFLVVGVLLWAATPEDAAISAKLKQKLSRSKLNSDGLQYKVQNGVVEWSGSVQIPQRKGAATRMAKSAGAKRVVNRITVNAQAHRGLQTSPRTATVFVPKR